MIINNTYEAVEAGKILQILRNLNGGKAIITFSEKNKANHLMIELVMKALSEEYPQIKFLKTYTQPGDPFLEQMKLHNLPVTLFMEGTAVKGWFSGLQSKNQIRKHIQFFFQSNQEGH